MGRGHGLGLAVEEGVAGTEPLAGPAGYGDFPPAAAAVR